MLNNIKQYIIWQNLIQDTQKGRIEISQLYINHTRKLEADSSSGGYSESVYGPVNKCYVITTHAYLKILLPCTFAKSACKHNSKIY